MKRLRIIGFVIIFSAATLITGFSSHAATVEGTFRYRDSDWVPRPIAFAKVEIWHRAWTGVWFYVGDGTTDANGFISYTDGDTGTYGVRVFATNYAAQVWPNDVVHLYPFYSEPGKPGPVINLNASSPASVLNFSFDFTDTYDTQHYNIAETLRYGFDYAAARRDPGETDPLPRADVQPTSATITSWYDPVINNLVIHSDHVFEDFVLLHEYTHFLEANISSFAWIPSNHNGCETRDALGNLINSPEHAWMEGFADYFAQAIARSLPTGTLSGTPGRGTSSVATLETPPPCSVSAGDAIENFVAASLWDLFDALSDTGAENEPHDFISRMNDSIFQIFDRELDIYGKWPTIWDFRNAWIARGLDRAALDRILSRYYPIKQQNLLLNPYQTQWLLAELITYQLP